MFERDVLLLWFFNPLKIRNSVLLVVDRIGVVFARLSKPKVAKP